MAAILNFTLYMTSNLQNNYKNELCALKLVKTGVFYYYFLPLLDFLCHIGLTKKY